MKKCSRAVLFSANVVSRPCIRHTHRGLDVTTNHVFVDVYVCVCVCALETTRGNIECADVHSRRRRSCGAVVAGFLAGDEDEKGNLGAKAPTVLDFYEHVNFRRRPYS